MAIEVGDAVWRIKGDTTELDAAVARSHQTIEKTFEASARKIGAAMTVAGAAVTLALGKAATSAASFGKAMANVSTLGVTNLEELDKGARDVAKRFGLDLNDAAAALYETISAGIPQDAAIMVMEQAARGAQAGVGTLADALDLGTSVMNAWNIKGKDANDTAAQMEKIMGMAATAAFKGKTTFADMAVSIGQVAPITAAAGVSTEEFFAALSGLTATGLPTSSAMTQIQQVISNIIKPSSIAAEMAEKLGLKFDAAALKSEGLAGMLDEVARATGGDLEKMGQLFGSVEALGAVISLTGNQAGLFKDTLGDMANAQKTLNEMTEAYIKNNPALAFDQLKAELQDISVIAGRAVLPALKSIVEFIAPIVSAITEWMQKHEGLSTGIIVVAGAIGVLMSVLGPLLMMMPGIVATFGLLGGGATAAAGVAGVGGLAGLTAGVIGFMAAFGPAIIAIGAAVWTFAAITKAMGETQAAQAQLAESSKRLSAAEEQHNAKLRAKGAILDEAIMKGMDYDQRLAYRAQQEVASADITLRAWIAHFAGRTATEEEFAAARNAALNENVTAQEAAMLAIQDSHGMAANQIMKADAETTAALLDSYGVRKRVQLDGATELTQAEIQAATRTHQAWVDVHGAVAQSAAQAAAQTQSIWQRVIDYLAGNMLWVIELVSRAAQAIGMLGPMPGVGGPVGMATGGTVQKSGWAMVGERGPELVQMPQGATVYDAGQTERALTGAGTGAQAGATYQVTNYFGRDSVRSEEDIREIERGITRLLGGGLQAAGVRMI